MTLKKLLTLAALATSALAPIHALADSSDSYNSPLYGTVSNDAAFEQNACYRKMVGGRWHDPEGDLPPEYDCAVIYWTWKTKGMTKQHFQAPPREDYDDWRKEHADAQLAARRAIRALRDARDAQPLGLDTFKLYDQQIAADKVVAQFDAIAQRDPMNIGLGLGALIRK